MKLAVMQPYFFPYLGYFQLIHAVNLFVAYDDVNFIKGGWIARNFVLLNCAPALVTVPLVNLSPYKTIAKTQVVADDRWRLRMLKTLRQAYSKAPNFAAVYALAEAVLRSPCASIAELAMASVRAVADYLHLNTDIRNSADRYGNSSLKGEARILDICHREGAEAYYNLPGGMALYNRAAFGAAGVDLRFLQPSEPRYRQFSCTFVSRLSIIDVLMFNSVDAAQRLLESYEVVDGTSDQASERHGAGS
jgi:hypothetical protein